jgi:hypothetical protein
MPHLCIRASAEVSSVDIFMSHHFRERVARLAGGSAGTATVVCLLDLPGVQCAQIPTRACPKWVNDDAGPGVTGKLSLQHASNCWKGDAQVLTYLEAAAAAAGATDFRDARRGGSATNAASCSCDAALHPLASGVAKAP